jgi:hypothetical protein
MYSDNGAVDVYHFLAVNVLLYVMSGNISAAFLVGTYCSTLPFLLHIVTWIAKALLGNGSVNTLKRTQQ